MRLPAQNEPCPVLTRKLMNMFGASDFSFANIIAGLIFSGVGLVAFVYGKKHSNFKTLSIGIVLMAYPYFLTSALWLYMVGIGLCLLLYYWRD